MNAAELAALLAALGALAGAVLGYAVKAQEVKREAQRDRWASEAQEEASALDGYDKLTRALQARLEIVEQKLLAAEKRMSELEAENARLREQVSAMRGSLSA